MVNWNAVFKKLFTIIDTGKGHESYFSGDRFIKKVQEVLDPFFPGYGKYIEERRSEIKSTTRRDYFEDILMGFDESSRMRLVGANHEYMNLSMGDQYAIRKDKKGP